MIFRKKMTVIMACAIAISSLTACASIEPDDPNTGQYATQTSMSSIEYGIYMNRQITVTINQIMGRMQGAKTNNATEQEIALAGETVETMQAVMDEVSVTKPAKTSDDDREMVLMAMETAITHMTDYKSALESGSDVRGFVEAFETDINDLTSLSNMYYQ